MTYPSPLYYESLILHTIVRSDVSGLGRAFLKSRKARRTGEVQTNMSGCKRGMGARVMSLDMAGPFVSDELRQKQEAVRLNAGSPVFAYSKN